MDSGLPVFQRKKSFLKRLIFTEKGLKKFFQSQDLAIEICWQTQRYSLWSRLVTWRRGFSQRFVFLGFFFLLENFYVGQDGAKWCDAPRHAVCGGCGRAPHATGGGPGSSARKFFANISSEKSILGQFKRPQEKKAFYRNWEKRFLPPKKGLKGFPWGLWIVVTSW